MDWIEKIRNKPERQRRIILWVSSTVLTLIFVLAWWILPRGGNTPAPDNQAASLATPPFEQLKSATGKALENIGNQYSSLKKTLGF
ncbi:MAG: hypothetical protein PHS53_04425 [Candidatus Pacebacteria bacterium]|nr:hypothetical protein [Candidatus Paceibacterota bacterium]MDD5068757.1 hypothetical protein [Candidatus Paceibacterota bacterium]MDD5357364.1 hypothetical protein [Candidatus Paceibacterota bacterium]